MEFEFCNVYRGTFGNTLPLMQRHPDAVVILWNLKDYDHVFFVTLSRLLPCLKDMSADHWSMIVFWNESSSKKPSSKPDVGLDYTDEPVPLPPPAWPPEDFPGMEETTGGPPDAPRAKQSATACSRVSAYCSDFETSRVSDPESDASTVAAECAADAIHGRASG